LKSLVVAMTATRAGLIDSFTARLS
jgi:hypothetical protein